MPVVTNEGLAGRIDAVIADAARVQLITDPASSVNVHLRNADTDAVLAGSVTGDVGLQLISQDANVESGDIILTSGLGGGFPPDLIIGQVVNVRRLPAELFQEATVQPAVDFTRLQIVLVITNFRAINTVPLVPTDDPLSMRNIIAIPVLGLAAILQSAIVSQFPLVGRICGPRAGPGGGLGASGRGDHRLPLGLPGERAHQPGLHAPVDDHTSVATWASCGWP